MLDAVNKLLKVNEIPPICLDLVRFCLHNENEQHRGNLNDTPAQKKLPTEVTHHGMSNDDYCLLIHSRVCMLHHACQIGKVTIVNEAIACQPPVIWGTP